jgi:uncharacterized protein
MSERETEREWIAIGPATEGVGTEVTATPRRRRGFAAMDPAKQKEIASKGGRAAHEKGRGHQWDREAAREAGRKGGLAARGKPRRRAATTPTGGEGGTQ